MRIKLERVHFMPTTLEPGVLYASEEFGIATHLCPCGCGVKVQTPLGPTDWSLTVVDGEPSLMPSVGSWQQACESHYWIQNGEIRWSTKWSKEQIEDGLKRELERHQAYYEPETIPTAEAEPPGCLLSIWIWITNLIKRK